MTCRHVAIIAFLMLGVDQWTRAADEPATRPAPPPPAIIKRVDDSLKTLADGSDDDRQLAEDRLLNTPLRAFPLIEAGLKHPGTDPDSRQRLARVVDHLRALDKAEAAERDRRQADSEWNVRTGLEAYDRVGRHDPKWDELARQAIREFLLRIEYDPAASFDALQQLTRDLKCDDPLVLYCDARVLELAASREPDADKKTRYLTDAVNAYQAACDGFDKVGYPADRKCLAYSRAASIMSTAAKSDAKFRERTKAWADDSLDMLPAVAKLPGITPAHLSVLCDWLVFVQMQFGADRGAIVDQMFPDLLKAAQDRPGPLVFKGRQYSQWAWDARGRGYGNTVTPEGWKKMGERLAVAEETLTKAYELDPSDGGAATAMLTVELGQGKGRDVMEKWFKRAIAADPRNTAAYQAKLYYLEPKWHGTPQDMLAFGHQCLATRDWSGRITSFLLQAHIELAQYTKDQTAYWLDPAVWPDVDAVVGRAAEIFPDDPRVRTQYAYWALKCGKWTTANNQFKLLGDKADVSVFENNPYTLKQARADAARKAAAQ